MEQTAESIAKAAYKGQEPDGFCDLADLHLHTCLMQLYADFKDNKIDKEQAEARKQRLVASWASDKDTEKCWRELTARQAEATRKAAGLNPESAKTPAECIGILAQIVAALTGDDSLPGRLKKQFGE